MKKLYILIYAGALFPKCSMAQYNQTSDVFTSKKIYFYGYDFTKFRFAEEKRMAQGVQIKDFLINELTVVLNDGKNEKAYQRALKKDSVIFDQAEVMRLNQQIDPSKIMSFSKNMIPKDSLQIMIDQYNTDSKEGVGFVQIMEGFYRPKKEALIWYVFFDIKTKKILWSWENINHDADSYHGLAQYWKVGIFCSLGQSVNEFRKEAHEYNK